MKLTEHIRQYTVEKFNAFSKQLCVEPKLLLTTKEVLQLPKEITQGRRTTAYKYFGVSYLGSNIVFINVKRIQRKKNLVNTIAHELVHIRFPYLSHGDKFNTIIKKVLKGKQFKPYQTLFAKKQEKALEQARVMITKLEQEIHLKGNVKIE